MEQNLDNALSGYWNSQQPKQTPQPQPQGVGENTIDKYIANLQQKNTDPDLSVGFEVVPLPSKGLFYSKKINELVVEYMTSRDEDIMTTPSLLESNTALDFLLKNKIKSKEINVDEMLAGDKNAVAIFLRASAYGYEYSVNVRDPRTGNYFESTIDLSKLKYKEIVEMPDENLEFTTELPVRKKVVKFKLLPERDVDKVVRSAKSKQEAYKLPYNEIGTMILKAHITEIGGKRDRDYISRFVDAMPIKDAAFLKKRIIEVTPNVDLKYTFIAPDGYSFVSPIEIGTDFFFPLT